jgi:hypothetical protein
VSPTHLSSRATPAATDADEKVEDKSTKIEAGYLGPEHGPFRCGGCYFFHDVEGGYCYQVAGHIDADGCCNLYRQAKG